MPATILGEIVSTHAATASETSNPFASLPRGAGGTVITARVRFVNALQASGSGVWTFSALVSYDRGATWTTVATGAAITLTAVAQDGEQLLSFVPSTPDSGQILVQVLATLTGSPTSPTIAYHAELLGGPF